MLSDGEFVMDAETVSMLGDGSNEAGAKRLDELRTNLRKHKGQNLSKGKFSANAKRPAEYFNEGGYVPPEENPYERGTARYRLWERKYGKKKKDPIVESPSNGKKPKYTAEQIKGKSEKWLKDHGLQRGGSVRNKRLARHMRTVARGAV